MLLCFFLSLVYRFLMDTILITILRLLRSEITIILNTLYFDDMKSVWYSAVVRGDVNKVTIGSKTSIGDRAVVHVAKIQSDFPTHIGDNVTVGAGAIIHAATVHDSVVVGEMAQILDGCVVNSNSVVAPASVVKPGTQIPSGELWAGSPAKKSRSLTSEEIANITTLANNTMSLALQHAIENAKSYDQVLEEEELADIEEYMDPDDKHYPEDEEDTDVLGQGSPGRVFRSTLSHPEEAIKEQQKKA
jgi:gamma-carbonic anhydrase